MNNSIKNNPAKKGEIAGRKSLFGDYSRYAVAPVHTRFESIAWFVWDAETTDENGFPETIRIADTYEEAILGL